MDTAILICYTLESIGTFAELFDDLTSNALNNCIEN
jgi:hypothetical protein